MEIERKFLVKHLPENLDEFPHKEFEQAYLCTEPVVRVRREGDAYILTYKSKGLMTREEYNMPLTKDAYEHLKAKADGIVITKTRYVIPERDDLKIELDLFHGDHQGLIMAEVEFATEETAKAYQPPQWFDREVTFDSRYHNSNMSKKR